MVTTENAQVGQKVFFHTDSGWTDLQEGTITEVVPIDEKKTKLMINGETKITVKRKKFYDADPIRESEDGLHYINGLESKVYLR
jgi:hypothetical protein